MGSTCIVQISQISFVQNCSMTFPPLQLWSVPLGNVGTVARSALQWSCFLGLNRHFIPIQKETLWRLALSPSQGMWTMLCREKEPASVEPKGIRLTLLRHLRTGSKADWGTQDMFEIPLTVLLMGRVFFFFFACFRLEPYAKSLQLCPTLRLHRRQPTRLPCPWDSPSKNTGVGCHFLLQCMKVKVKSLSRVRLPATPWTAAQQAPPSTGLSKQEHWSGVPLPYSPLNCFYVFYVQYYIGQI